MANITFTNTGSSIKVTLGDKAGDYGFKELEIPKNSTPLIVEEDGVHLTFYSNGDRTIVDFNDVDTPSDTTSASNLRDKLSDFFFKEGLFIAQYPLAHTDVYIKTTTFLNDQWEGEDATDPTRLKIGNAQNHVWLSGNGEKTNQRFHIDLGGAKIIKGVNYHNYHSSGTGLVRGVKVFTMWGSNSVNDFTDLVYVNDGTWNLLTTDASQLDQHIAEDVSDEKSFAVIDSAAYRYYAFKFANNWGDATYMGLRHIELLSRF